MRLRGQFKEPSLGFSFLRARALPQSPTTLTADDCFRRVVLKPALVPIAGTHCGHLQLQLVPQLHPNSPRLGLNPSTSGGFKEAGDATLQPAPAPPMRAAAPRAAGDWLRASLGVVCQRQCPPCAPPQRPPKLIALALSRARLRREGPRRLAVRLLARASPWAYDLEP